MLGIPQIWACSSSHVLISLAGIRFGLISMSYGPGQEIRECLPNGRGGALDSTAQQSPAQVGVETPDASRSTSWS